MGTRERWLAGAGLDMSGLARARRLNPCNYLANPPSTRPPGPSIVPKTGVNTRYFGNPNPTPGLTLVYCVNLGSENGFRDKLSVHELLLGTAFETYLGYVSRHLRSHTSVTSLFRVPVPP